MIWHAAQYMDDTVKQLHFWRGLVIQQTDSAAAGGEGSVVNACEQWAGRRDSGLCRLLASIPAHFNSFYTQLLFSNA